MLAGCRGRTISLVPLWQVSRALTERLPARCTSLSWYENRNLWVAAGNTAYLMPGAGFGSTTPPKQITVVCPVLQALPEPAMITSLRVAPDGVRVAMIVRYHNGTKAVLVAAASKNASYTYLAQTEVMARVGSDIADPMALTWLDPDHLLVLAKSGSASQIFESPLNGGTSTEIAAPGGVPSIASIASNWPTADGIPRLVVAVPGSGGRAPAIYSADAGLLNRGWSQLPLSGSTPVFPG